MRTRTFATGTTAAALLALAAGCNSTLFLNLTKEKTGTINVQFVNDTPYRAIFTIGAWDAWENEGAITIQQRRIGGNTTPAAFTMPCTRNLAIGTENMVERVLVTKTDQTTTNFDPEAFDVVVRFSRGAEGTPTAGLPTEGTAGGIELLLGVDYSCADTIVFTFVQDPDAPGGFRIDRTVVRDVLPGEETG